MLPDGKVVPLDAPLREEISVRIGTMTSQALRTLSLAIRFDADALALITDASHPEHSRLLDPDNFVQYVILCVNV